MRKIIICSDAQLKYIAVAIRVFVDIFSLKINSPLFSSTFCLLKFLSVSSQL